MNAIIHPLPRPGMQHGQYPERHEVHGGWLEHAILKITASCSWRDKLQVKNFLHHVNAIGTTLAELGDIDFKARTGAMRRQLYCHGLAASHTAEAFALIREASRRTLGLYHYDEQIMGGRAMLKGMLAEMETGEGKTLAAILPACTAAWAGIPVHVITVNDYLVQRDAAHLKPVYAYLGLSVGAVTEGMDDAARRDAYACDVTYCTSKQLAFDYLRDRIALKNSPGKLALQVERLHQRTTRLDRLLLRGLCFAIVDEADSVLIDEACTPLVISRPGKTGEQLQHTCKQALSLAGELAPATDFVLEPHDREVRITRTGKALLAANTEGLGETWRLERQRETWVCQALAAMHLYQRDREYLVRDGNIRIIDDFTGRVMGDRTWEHGLHQMIEVKEGCEVSTPNETLARISYQRFFSRYLHLCGMTGTAREAGGELQATYAIKVLAIPPHRPSRLTPVPGRMFAAAADKWQAVVDRARSLHEQRRPLLIGTRSVADSEHIGRLLSDANLPHQILNARQDRHEAELIARAGNPACITVATNMAGRGTDIPLAAGVAETGGLHVIATERNAARRIDRQLFGRCARQGEPGSFESILSLEDEIIARFLPQSLRAVAVMCLKGRFQPPQWAGRVLLGLCQGRSERHQRRQRRELEKMDEYLGQFLAFSGRSE